MDHPWEVQKARKYRDHDLSVDDMTTFDFLNIKDRAIHDIVNTVESDQTKLIISAFMGFLTKKGFRITKENK